MKICNQNKKISIENMTKNLGAFQWLLLNMLGFMVITFVIYFIFWGVFGYVFEIDLDLLAGIAIFFFIPVFAGLVSLMFLRKGLLKIFDENKGKWNLFKKLTFKKVLFWSVFVVYIVLILFLTVLLIVTLYSLIEVNIATIFTK